MCYITDGYCRGAFNRIVAHMKFSFYCGFQNIYSDQEKQLYFVTDPCAFFGFIQYVLERV